MPGIDQMTIEIKPPMNPDGAEAVLGFMVSEAEKATQLPAISGIILRDEPTEEVVGPGEWFENVVTSIGTHTLGIENKTIAQVWKGNRWMTADIMSARFASENPKGAAERHLAENNLHGYRIETTRHITAEVVGDVTYKSYMVCHLCEITNEDPYFVSGNWEAKMNADNQYASHVAAKISCSLCGILPGGVPVVLKSYDPEKEIKP